MYFDAIAILFKLCILDNNSFIFINTLNPQTGFAFK
ncbi:MAG: hypothetical protein JG771_104 [Methermicoccus sp.]|nr:hypothetical protein [Methermicoccus sp.]